MIFHPTTNSILAGMAHAILYLSVLAPIFWAPQLKLTPERISAVVVHHSGQLRSEFMVGILQVYDPGTWMPTELSSMVTGTLGGIR